MPQIAPRAFPWSTTLLIIAVTVIAAAIGAAVSGGSEDAWYAALNKPRLNPPDAAFAVVWPILYVLMAIGAIIVARACGGFARASEALGLFFTQLGVNAVWSVFFFTYHAPIVAFGTITALWLLIIAMIRAFAKRSKLAAVLQIPYLGWVTFAAYLNAFIVAGN